MTKVFITILAIARSITKAIFSLVEQVNKDHLPRFITSRQGDAVLLSKSDWESIQDTLYLQSIPNLVESIRAAEQANDWVSEDEFLGALNGMEDSI
jgi:prevent-host-death family protein